VKRKEAPTWHYGLVADYWAEFNLDGPEIPYYQRFVERGQPAIDAGCGTGRLLIPWLQAGLDVDGCDASADMIDRCRARAKREGLAPTLLVQPLHELDPPRRYRTAVVCGVFGLGSTREQDAEALRRLRGALEPGGTLLLDMEVPYANPRHWPQWTREGRARLPESWPGPETAERRAAGGGSEYRLRTRSLALDPLDQRLDLEIRIEKWRDDQLVAAEEHRLAMRLYFKEELALLLEREGFSEVVVRAAYEDREPTPDDDFLVYEARA
jgi:SAM-dependent methyltransferase